MSSANIQNRIRLFREKLKEKGIDGALVSKRENYMYLSGFTGTSAWLVISQTEAVLLTDFRYTEQASKQAPDYELVEYRGSSLKALDSILKRMGLGQLGIEDRYLSYFSYTEYKKGFGEQELVPLEDTIENLRDIKDKCELDIIEKAVDVADQAFSHVLGFIKPGVSEMELAAELEYKMKKLGAKGPSFETIVASGKRSAMPHGVASLKKVEAGDTITFDFGAIYEDYCSDMTRTVFLGEPCNEMKKIYEKVLEAQLKAIEGAVTGLFGKDIDAIARNIITDAGYGNNFGHGLGHGVGLEIHEEPRLSMTGNIKMENGMVVTVEPGIYVAGLGGVRIEDIIVINDDKPLVLTKSTKEMIVI